MDSYETEGFPAFFPDEETEMQKQGTTHTIMNQQTRAHT